MSYRVIVTARAEADAIEAFRWKADRSTRVAARWLAGLDKAITRLGTFPESHPIAEEETERLGMPLREMNYGKKPGTYRLLFTVEGDTVVLHFVQHAARDWGDQDKI